MRATRFAAAGVAALCAGIAAGQTPTPRDLELSATAEVTTSQGTRSMPVTIIIARPLSKEEARPLREVLANGGQQALLASIRGGNRGRMNLGNLEYPLDLIVAEPISDGVRYVIVTTRSLKIEEVNDSAPSLDYPFAVAIFEVPEFGSGRGQLYRRASLAVQENGRILLEHYDEEPGRLKDIRRR
ncbi:MAG TPA: hypothetical protein VIA45_11010 [Thermoanaerobaculia bacterium]|jgi:hypothetical protein